MYLLSAKEIEDLKAANVQVLNGYRTGSSTHRVNYEYSKPTARKALVVVWADHELLGEFSNKVTAVATGICYIVLFDGVVVDKFHARTGSWYSRKDRSFANLYRKRALRKAKKLLKVWYPV